MPSVDRRRPSQLSLGLWSTAVAAFVTAVYTLYSAWQWDRYAIRSWDLGIFTQLAKAYASFDAPIVPIKGDGYNLLGDHFHPLLVLLGPPYALFPHAFTLLVVQNLCFGVAAGLICFFAMRRLRPVTGVLVGLAFGFAWGLQYAVEAQFHEIAFAVPLLAASLIGIAERRWWQAWVFGGLLVFVKEDLGLTVVMIGLVLAWRSRKRVHLWLSAWGVAWFGIATLVVLPLLNPKGSWAYTGNLNTWAMLSDPTLLFHTNKWWTVTLILASTALISLRSPIILIALPTLGWRFLSANEGYWPPTWHYSAVLIPIIFVAMLDGIRLSRTSRQPWFRSYGRIAPVISIVVAAMLMPQLPLWDAATSSAGTRNAEAAGAIAAVPAGASVESDIGLMSYLVDDHVVFWLGNDNPAADCMMIDRTAGGTPREWGDVIEVADRKHPGVSYELRYDAAGYQLACQQSSR